MPQRQPTKVARWYPAPPPALPGENNAQYTDRLTGADGTGHTPYDHRRNRQCSIGWHLECSCWRTNDGTCHCPCHSDITVPAEALSTLDADAVARMRRMYSIPERTAQRVVYLGRQAIDNGVRTLTDFRQHIGTAYQSEINEGFGIDLAWVLDCADRLEGCPPVPR